METEKYKKFLPSRHFVKVIAICIGGLIVIFIVTSLFGSHSIFSRKQKPLVEAKGTVSELVVQDVNGNGIQDWEEALWGLDPKADGAKNKALIAEKKTAAGIKTEDDSVPTNQTDAFSRHLLATIIALQQSGGLTEEAITNLAASIGDNADAKHATIDLYKIEDIQTVQPSTQSRNTYKNQLKKVLDRYSDLELGSEVNIIANGLDSGGTGAFVSLEPIAQAYIEIGQAIIEIPTPTDASSISLALANTSLQMGTYLEQVSGLYDDAISGMIGLDDYVKASVASDKATEKMRAYLSL